MQVHDIVAMRGQPGPGLLVHSGVPAYSKDCLIDQQCEKIRN